MNLATDSLRYPEERRLATVLFADVQGFTALAEQLDFETVSDLLKGIWERLDKAIESHNGYIDKHLGDGVMAVWGAPFAGENDAEQAVAAGLDLIKALQEYRESSHIPGAEGLKLRVGVNTGQVFAGYVGTRREYTVFGDTVNLASRLEQIAPPGMVVIGENTLRMVRDGFRVRRLEPTMAKGKTDLVQPYLVEGRPTSTGHVRSQNIDSLVTNMVGREEELKKLMSLYEQAFETGRPVMALVNGDVGVGKTRLLMEFWNQIEDGSEKVILLSAKGVAQTTKLPFSLWRSLFRNRFGLREDDPPQETLEKWTQGVQHLWGPDAPEVLEEATLVLGGMLGLPGLDPQPIRQDLQRTAFLCRELLNRFGSHKRLILFLDDLQWADRESLQLLSRILTGEDEPLKALILAATRLEFLKSQSQWHNLARVISLYPLELTPAMVSQAYPDLHTLPEAILEEISLHAEGNPYFLGEIIKSLLKGGLLTRPENLDSQEIRGQLLSQIPASLRATLQARMDNLSREARVVALLASVVGRVFWVGAVQAAARSTPLAGSTPMLNIPEAVIDRFIQDGLRQLVRADLAFPRSGKYSDQQEYYFKNSYLRDVAYSLIPNRNRAQYHKAVAEWMLQLQDPAFLSLAGEHERKAALSANVPTDNLAPLPLEK